MPDICTENPRDCPHLHRIEELEKAQEREEKFREEYYTERAARIAQDARLDERTTSMDKKLDKLIEWQDEQQERLAKVDSIPELTKRVTALESRPGRRWDFLGDKILWFLIELVLVAAAVKIGLK